MKTAVSIPDPVFEAAERLARRLGKSRSQLHADALRSYVETREETGVTQCLNEIYGADSERSKLDPALEELQWRSLPKEKW